VFDLEINETLITAITKIVLEEIKKHNIAFYSNGFIEKGLALSGIDLKEVVIGISPDFGKGINNTIAGLSLKNVIKEVTAGIEEEGMLWRIIRVLRSSDLSIIGKEAALMSGSGISIGIQSKGTTVIHQKDLYPLSNLELFPQAPLISLNMYRHIGKNAARYAKGIAVKPVPVQNDFMSRAEYQVKAALMHIKETEKVIANSKSIEIGLDF
jgi:glycerol dehydratase medium subunit/propanediol dehydratase medium subunit